MQTLFFNLSFLEEVSWAQLFNFNLIIIPLKLTLHLHSLPRLLQKHVTEALNNDLFSKIKPSIFHYFNMYKQWPVQL